MSTHFPLTLFLHLRLSSVFLTEVHTCSFPLVHNQSVSSWTSCSTFFSLTPILPLVWGILSSSIPVMLSYISILLYNLHHCSPFSLYVRLYYSRFFPCWAFQLVYTSNPSICTGSQSFLVLSTFRLYIGITLLTIVDHCFVFYYIPTP